MSLQQNNPINAPPREERSSSEKESEKLDRLLKKTHRVLLKTSSVFPFTLFPDDVTIDECKVNIILRTFFYSEDIHSIHIDMIKDVEVQTSLFFATLKVVPDGYPGKPLSVRYLKKGDAIRARRIIQGLIVAKKEGIDPEKTRDSNLAEKIENIGKIQSAE